MEDNNRNPLEDLIPRYNTASDIPTVTSQDYRDKRSLLLGATPLLVGLLAGNTGDAATIAGKALIDEDQRQLKEDGDFANYLRKVQFAKDKAKEESNPFGKMQAKQLESGEYASFSPITGKFYNPNTREEIQNPMSYRETPGLVEQKTRAREKVLREGGKGQILTKDVQGRTALVDRGSGKMKVIEKLDGMAPKKRNLILKQVGEFEKITKSQRDAIDSANKFMEAIKLGNPVSDQFAIFQLAKTADNGGRLSDQDVARFGGSKAYGARLAQVKKDALDGTLTAENRAFMIEIAAMMKDVELRQLSKKAARFSRSRNELIGEDISPYLMTYSDEESSRVIVTNGKDTFEIPASDLKEARNDGFKLVDE